MAVVDLGRYDTLFFDCDGVLWYGSESIQGSAETLRKLHAMGKEIYFITNNSFQTQEQLAQKITKFGYNCAPKQVYCSAKATIFYLQTRYPSIRKVYLLGEASFRSELLQSGFQVVHKSDFPEQSIKSLEQLKAMRPDTDIGAVVLGFQTGFNYLAAYYGAMCVQAGAKLVASNDDMYLLLKDGVRMPGCGALVKFLETATDVKAEVVGKPAPYFWEMAQRTDQVDLGRSLMIGDSLMTDIPFASQAGMDSLLVLSGVTKLSELPASAVRPTYVLPSVADLFSTHARM